MAGISIRFNGRAVASRSFSVAAMALACVPPALGAQDQADLGTGRVHYMASCARCHGVDGGGGEGPPLARSRLERAPDDSTLVSIIVGGIPGTGMSGSWWLSERESSAVARYVRSLAPSGPDGAEVLTGDPTRGRALFESEGCARCHTIGGFGTARGPDLSAVGSRRGPAHLRQALVDPAAVLPRGLSAMPREFVDYLVVRVVDGAGRELRGMRMNEDSYTIQIKDARGVVHSYYKPELRSLEREFDRSLMQSYADRLSDEELEDLVAYLASLTGTQLRGIS